MKKLLFVLLFIVISTCFAEVVKWRGALYTVTEGESLTFKWDRDPEDTKSEFFELRCIWMDPATAQDPISLGRTSELEMEITRPKTGHFVYQVRAGYFNPDTQEEEFSDWASSDNEEEATVDGEPCPWRIFWKLPAPTNPVIE